MACETASANSSVRTRRTTRRDTGSCGPYRGAQIRRSSESRVTYAEVPGDYRAGSRTPTARIGLMRVQTDTVGPPRERVTRIAHPGAPSARAALVLLARQYDVALGDR